MARPVYGRAQLGWRFVSHKTAQHALATLARVEEGE